MMAARRYAVQLDGLTQEVHGDRLRPLGHPCDAGGDAWLVSDLDQGLSRVERVDTPPRYAEMVVRKRLQDAGEFTEPVQILTHWKRKVSGGRSDIFYTAVPERQTQQFVRQLRDCPHNLLVFPLQAVLWSTLRGLPGRETTVVVFAHDRFVDLLLGDRTQALAALRITAYDTDPAAMEGLWESVRQEIRHHAEALHVQVKRMVGFSWQVDGPEFSRHLEESAAAVGAEPRALPATTLAMEGAEATFEDSLPQALAGLAAGQSISPAAERLAYAGQRAAPWVLAGAATAVVALVAAGWWLEERGRALEAEVAALQREIAASPVARLPPPPPYAETMAFVRELERVNDGPAYRALLGDLSDALAEDLRVDALTVVHGEEAVDLEVFGSAVAGFREAQYGHQGFLAKLRRRGYQVAEQEFSTRIDASDFKVTLQRPRP